MKKFILILPSLLICFILSACTSNVSDSTSSNSVDFTMGNTDNVVQEQIESIYISTNSPEEINIENNDNIPTYSTNQTDMTIIERSMTSTSNKQSSLVNTIANKNHTEATLKKALETHLSNSDNAEYSQYIEDIKPKRVEVKTILVKPVVNAMYETQPITNNQAKAIAENIQDEDTIIQSTKYKNPSIQHLMENYTNITKTSSVCCVSNIASQLKNIGINSKDLVNILKNDANNFYVQDTCLILSNEDIDNVFGKNNFSKIIKDTRKSCICTNKNFIQKNIASFYKIYNQDPDFYKKTLFYRYKDKQGRTIEHDINETVLNIALTLEECPNL